MCIHLDSPLWQSLVENDLPLHLIGRRYALRPANHSESASPVPSWVVCAPQHCFATLKAATGVTDAQCRTVGVIGIVCAQHMPEALPLRGLAGDLAVF